MFSGPVPGGKPECADFRIPLFHGAAAAHQTKKGRESAPNRLAGGCVRGAAPG